MGMGPDHQAAATASGWPISVAPASSPAGFCGVPPQAHGATGVDACATLSIARQRLAGHFFEDAERRIFRRHQRADGDDEGLFEGVLAGEDRVRDGIGVAHPGGHGRKGNGNFRAVLLEGAVLLQIIVEAQHEFVISGAVRPFDADGAFEEGEDGEGGTGMAGDFLQSGRARVFFGQSREGIGGDPVAGTLRIDVGEATQDAPAVGGPRREGVQMQKVVALVQRKGAALLLLRPETGVIQ